jgi:signal recognition particle GTPase
VRSQGAHESHWNSNKRWARGFLSQVAVRVKNELRVVFGVTSLSRSLFDVIADSVGNTKTGSETVLQGEDESLELVLQISDAPLSTTESVVESLTEAQQAKEKEKKSERQKLHQREQLSLLLRGHRDVENIDATEILFSHSDYPAVLPSLVKMLRLQ